MSTYTSQFECESCGAAPGEPCTVSRSGKPARRPHASRAELAQRAAERAARRGEPRTPGAHGITLLMRSIRKPRPEVVSEQPGMNRLRRRQYAVRPTLPGSNVPYRKPTG